MEVKFCPKCHKEAYKLIEKNGNIQIIQGRNTLISMDKSSSGEISINCPSRHPVKVFLKGGK